MARFEHLFFVCGNLRDADDPRGCCGGSGSPELLSRLKELTFVHKLKGRVRVTSSGCLNLCAKACSVVVFSAEAPAGESWYVGVRPEDADELFETHVLRGQRLERLLLETPV